MHGEIRNVYIVMYDITHDRTLQKVSRLLEQTGFERINYSVWTGLHNPDKVTALKSTLKKLLDNPITEGSKIYILPLTLKDFSCMKSWDGKEIEQMEYWIGVKPTEFF